MTDLAPAVPADFAPALHGAALEARLPHRGDMLFARSVRVCSPETFEGTASWPADLGLLEGHFPGRPIVPGVLLVEGAAQVAGAALNVIDDIVSGGAAREGVLGMIRRCVFRAPVFPGETVRYQLAIEHATGPMVAVGGTASRGGQVVAELSFVLARTGHRAASGGEGS